MQTLPPQEQERTFDTGTGALEQALSIDPDYFDALVYMGLAFRQKSSYLASLLENEKAGEAFNKAEEFRKRAEAIGKKRMADGR